MFSLYRLTSRLSVRNVKYCRNMYSTNQNSETEQVAEKTGGFAKAYERQTNITDNKTEQENLPFATLLRNSKLMDVSMF